MYLLDTNICSELIRKASPGIINRLEDNKGESIYISQVTISELFFGCEKTKDAEGNKAALEKFLLPFDLLAYDYEAAEIYGAIRAGLEKSSLRLGPYDLMLAAQALAHDLILVSNKETFTGVPALRTELWGEGASRTTGTKKKTTTKTASSPGAAKRKSPLKPPRPRRQTGASFDSGSDIAVPQL